MTPRRLLFALAILLLTAGALAVRLPRLGQRPMHCDEANQAKKAADLLETGRYDYDPHDHHGPSLCWLTLPVLRLRGVSNFAATSEADYRLAPVVFGAGLVLLVFLLADGLGGGPAILAALLTAISPAMVYYSRYYIHETLLVFFTSATIGCGWRYFRSGAWGWAAACGASLGLLYATKETWVLAAAAMGVALLLTIAWERRNSPPAQPKAGQVGPANGHIALRRLRPWPLLAAVGTATVVATAFYIFGAPWHAPLDSLLAYANYWHRGTSGIHTHPWYYYLQLLAAFHPARGFFWSEGLIAGLAVVGMAASIGGARCGLTAAQQTLGRFLTCYTLTLTLLYAAIPYKTPWCALSLLDGMILLAGPGAWAILPRGLFRARASLQAIPQQKLLWLRRLACLLVLAGGLHLGWQCYELNFRFSNDERNPWVYAQTSADALQLARQMERLARVSPEGHDMVIHVVMPEEYWPLPWYLRKFNADHVGYWRDVDAWSRETGGQPPPAVIIFSPAVQPLVDRRLRAAYDRQMIFGLRGGVLVSVYVRDDLWQALPAAE
jgi:uncharacterized protein (TIGR03663 family)